MGVAQPVVEGGIEMEAFPFGQPGNVLPDLDRDPPPYHIDEFLSLMVVLDPLVLGRGSMVTR
jgi:hypothetical protein